MKCANNGGAAIGAGHDCICVDEKGHNGNHGCECGALWPSGAGFFVPMDISPHDEELKRHELSETLKGKNLRALLKWVYDHGQLKGEFPDQSISKDFVLKLAEKAIKDRDTKRDAYIIGEDDKTNPYNPDGHDENRLRAKQRQRAYIWDSKEQV